MDFRRQEGIVIKSFDYQESKKILTIFTPEGLLNLIATVKQNHYTWLLLTSPLSIAEFHYKPNRSSLHTLKEGCLISSYLNYRHSYLHLQTAYRLIETLVHSQLPEVASPLLYQLLRLYLEKLPSFDDPKLLSMSFMLKTLRHGGLISLEGLCSTCQKPSLRAFHLKERYCRQCMPPDALCFTDQEYQDIELLLFCRNIETLKLLKSTDDFHNKVHTLFKNTLS